MIWLKGGRISWRLRYGAVLAVSAGGALLCGLMLSHRTLFEPSVRLLHAALSLRFAALGAYEQALYGLYTAFVGFLSAFGFAATVWSLATHRSTDAKIDRYLAPRLPQHQASSANTQRNLRTTSDEQDSRGD